MSTRQLQAGYILDSVRERLFRTQFAENGSLNKLLRSLCYFDIAITSSERPPIAKTIPSEISVADNLVSRGLPTRPSFLSKSIMPSCSNHATLMSRLTPKQSESDRFSTSWHAILVLPK